MTTETVTDAEKIEKLAKWLDFQFEGPQIGNQVRAIGQRLAAMRRERDDQRRRAEAAERRCWAVRPGSGPGDVPCCLRRGHEGDHWSSTGCAGSEVTWPTAAARIEAAQALIDAWRDEAKFGHGAYREVNERRADELTAALAAPAAGEAS